MLASERSPEGQALLLLGWTQALLGTQHQTKSYTQRRSSLSHWEITAQTEETVSSYFQNIRRKNPKYLRY